VIVRAYPSSLSDMMDTFKEIVDDDCRGDANPCSVIDEVNNAEHNAIVGDVSGVQDSAGVPPDDKGIAYVNACVSEPHNSDVIVWDTSGVRDSASVSSHDNHYEIVDDTPSCQALQPRIVDTSQFQTLQSRIAYDQFNPDEEVFGIIDDEHVHQDDDEKIISRDFLSNDHKRFWHVLRTGCLKDEDACVSDCLPCIDQSETEDASQASGDERVMILAKVTP
jgi:hypothetical protein